MLRKTKLKRDKRKKTYGVRRWTTQSFSAFPNYVTIEFIEEVLRRDSAPSRTSIPRRTTSTSISFTTTEAPTKPMWEFANVASRDVLNMLSTIVIN